MSAALDPTELELLAPPGNEFRVRGVHQNFSGAILDTGVSQRGDLRTAAEIDIQLSVSTEHDHDLA